MTELETKVERTCPVCDESVPADASRCPSCSTDLTLFEHNGKRIEIDAEEIPQVKADDSLVGDLLKAADQDLFTGEAASIEVFECPECKTEVPMDASTCPGCGVMFAEGEAFECPLCKTMVDSDTDKCPSCGAEFANDTQDVSSESPVPEGPKVELSFAERMKAMKDGKEPGVTDTPAIQPASTEPVTPESPPEKKEISFAERIKAMKEGKRVEMESSIEPPTPPQKIIEEEKTSKVGMPSAVLEQKPSQHSLKDEYKDLPKLISIVKKHLALAKRCNLDVRNSRTQINQAVAAGKNKDLDTAVRLVKEGKQGIETSISNYLKSRTEAIMTRAEEGKKKGQSFPKIDEVLPRINKQIQENDFNEALNEIEKIEPLVAGPEGDDILDAVSELKKVEGTLEDAKKLNIDVDEAHELFIEAQKAAESEDWDTANLFSKQSMDNLTQVLPDQITHEMKKAKANLLEIKMMNINITRPVEFLKDANIALKEKNYSDALHSIRQFKDFMEKENFVT